MNELVTVKICDTRLEAELARGYLEANGIKAIVSVDDEGGMYPYPIAPTVNPARVRVTKKDQKKAEVLLKGK